MELTKEQHGILINWANKYLIPRPSINYDVNTSDIRKSFEFAYAKGFYVDNVTVNLIMRELGYRAACFHKEPYLSFNVSNQSPALREYRRYTLTLPEPYQKYE